MIKEMERWAGAAGLEGGLQEWHVSRRSDDEPAVMSCKGFCKETKSWSSIGQGNPYWKTCALCRACNQNAKEVLQSHML